MANKVKKLFVIGSVVSGLFMAITACNFAHSSQPSSQDSSNQEFSECISRIFKRIFKQPSSIKLL